MTSYKMESRQLTDHELFNTIATNYARKDVVPSSYLACRYQLLFAMEPVLGCLGVIDTIVEVGCGVAAPAQYLEGHYRRYMGIDYSEKLIAIARVFNQGNDRAEFVIANIKSANLRKINADVVLVVGVLHHTTELDTVMESLIRLAKPGGFLVAVEPQNGNPVIQSLRFLRGIIDSTYSREQHFFSRHELVTLLERHGLCDVETVYQGYLSTPFAQMVFPWQGLVAPLSKAAIAMDEVFQRYLPKLVRRLSWNIVVRARFP